MTRRLTWLRLLASIVVAAAGVCLPFIIESRAPAVRIAGGSALERPSTDASALVAALGAGRQPVSLLRIRANVTELRSVDLDADGRPDLVATGDGRLRTWLNVGSGRFVEHAATHTLLRHSTTPGFTTRQRSTRIVPAALIGDRHALAPSPGSIERDILCTFFADVSSSAPALGPIEAGGSRAPPPIGLS